MARLREERQIPGSFELTDSVAASITASLARTLVPGLEGSVGAVDWRKGDEAGRDWTAEGFIDELTTVLLWVRPQTRQVVLVLDTNLFERPSRSDAWFGYMLLAFLAAGFAVGFARHSPWWGLGVTIGLVVAEMAFEIVLKERRRTRAGTRLQGDADTWKTRLDQALAEAIKPFEE